MWWIATRVPSTWHSAKLVWIWARINTLPLTFVQSSIFIGSPKPKIIEKSFQKKLGHNVDLFFSSHLFLHFTLHLVFSFTVRSGPNKCFFVLFFGTFPCIHYRYKLQYQWWWWWWPTTFYIYLLFGSSNALFKGKWNITQDNAYSVPHSDGYCLQPIIGGCHVRWLI